MRRLVYVFLALFGVLTLGTLGLRLIEGASWLDCFYMSVITLTTVGFGETVPLSPNGKVFIIVYLMVGLGVFTFCGSILGEWIISSQMRSVMVRRRMQMEIDKLENHYIVCGAGRMGKAICEYLEARHQKFVVIDSHEEVVELSCEEHGWPHVLGDATTDEVLLKAGIERAKALATALTSDADNVYVSLSARLLNPKIQIIARAGDEGAVKKLEKAGATKVVSPFNSGAVRMARFMLNPTFEDFFEVVGTIGGMEMIDLQLPADNPYVGKMLKDTDLSELGVMVIGLRRTSGEQIMPLKGTTELRAGDRVFALGNAKTITDTIGKGTPHE